MKDARVQHKDAQGRKGQDGSDLKGPIFKCILHITPAYFSHINSSGNALNGQHYNKGNLIIPDWPCCSLKQTFELTKSILTK